MHHPATWGGMNGVPLVSTVSEISCYCSLSTSKGFLGSLHMCNSIFVCRYRCASLTAHLVGTPAAGLQSSHQKQHTPCPSHTRLSRHPFCILRENGANWCCIHDVCMSVVNAKLSCICRTPASMAAQQQLQQFNWSYLMPPGLNNSSARQHWIRMNSCASLALMTCVKR